MVHFTLGNFKPWNWYTSWVIDQVRISCLPSIRASPLPSPLHPSLSQILQHHSKWIPLHNFSRVAGIPYRNAFTVTATQVPQWVAFRERLPLTPTGLQNGDAALEVAARNLLLPLPPLLAVILIYSLLWGCDSLPPHRNAYSMRP